MVAERALSIRAKDLMFGDTRAARRSGLILNVVKLFFSRTHSQSLADGVT